MSTHGIAAWIRPIYLYLVSLIAIIVFIIGTVSITHLLIRTYIFGLKFEYYSRGPEASCEYILTQKNISNVSLKFDRPVAIPLEEINDGEELSMEEREGLYDRCVVRQEKEQEEQAKYSFANRMSNGIAMILVSVPIFLFHWHLIRRERKT